MEFKKREEYSIGKKGVFFQISQDEFLHRSYYYPTLITWIKGNKRTEQEYEYVIPFGFVDNSFFFEKDKIIKKAKLINDQIVTSDSVKMENGTKVLFKWHCPYYFIERENTPNALFAIPINEDYRSSQGVKFNVSSDELEKFARIHIQDNFLFGITDHRDSCSIRRYQSDSEEYLEKEELTRVFNRSVIFNNWIFYMSYEGDLISVNMNDFSHEIMKTNLEKYSSIVGIDENGMVTVQSFLLKTDIHLFAAQLPEKFIVSESLFLFVLLFFSQRSNIIDCL